jgi:hypothetical protein
MSIIIRREWVKSSRLLELLVLLQYDFREFSVLVFEIFNLFMRITVLIEDPTFRGPLVFVISYMLICDHHCS